MTLRHAISALLTVSLTTMPMVSPAWGGDLPSGGVVTSGTATIGAEGTTGLVIDQSSDKAIIEWDGFSIGSGHTTTFYNGDGATLNRVVGADVSSIYGTLTATGSLYLVNPNGILIGPSGVIETGGSFVASTLDVSDQDFLDGGDLTFSGSAETVVVNMGSVSSLGGDVGFIARTIVNDGTLSAPEGTVGLAAGREVLLRDTALDDGKFLVKVGESGDSVTESGVIRAAMVELKANGGNIYALAGNDGGMISATGSTQTTDGRVLLTAGDGSITVDKTITASREITTETATGTTTTTTTQEGGEIILNADVVTVTGLLDASGADGDGGAIDIGAGTLITLTGATLDASGTGSGGTVRVGGEVQGGYTLTEDEVENVQALVMDAASRIDVSGASGDGGTVILWSEAQTDFEGTITATGGTDGAGGFAEVSSYGALTFAGTVNTGGGTLLLDPTNITINSATASSITTALEFSDVVVTTHDDSGSDNGNITVTSALTYSSAYSLTLLAEGNITIKASIQNSYYSESEAGGDVTLVAGWDGSSGVSGTLSSGVQTGLAVDTSVFDAADLSSTTPFGGTVTIGNGSQTSGIAVGSRSGATRVYADALTITAGDSDRMYAQLGYQASDEGASYTISGDIVVRLTGDLTVTAREVSDITKRSYAQIGHVGADTYGDSDSEASVVDADITVEAAGTVTLSGGDGEAAYAQIGHGGFQADASLDGDITISAQALSLTAGSPTDYAYAQVGHGGANSSGAIDGDITITTTGALTVTGGSANYAYAQVGHGGANSSGAIDGEIDGAITITTTGALTLTGGSSRYTYAQVGHGGGASGGTNFSGAITIEAGTLTVTGGSWISAYAQVGHGGDASSGAIDGDITITTTGALTVTGGDYDDAYDYAYAQVGHGGANSSGAIDGDITISAQALSLTAGSYSNYAYAQIGHGGYDSDGTLSGAITIETGALTVTGGKGVLAYAQIGHGGYQMSAVSSRNSSGDITITTTGDLSVTGGSAQAAYAQIGHGGYGSKWASSGAITITATGDLTVEGGSYSNATAQIGHGGVESSGGINGESDITIETGKLTVTGGSKPYSHAQIGHGGYTSSGDLSGAITITTTDALTVTGGSGTSATAQIGHGGYDSSGDIDGAITITATGALTVTGGSANYASAQIGHGGYSSDGDSSGDIFVSVDGELSLEDGSGTNASAWLGHDTNGSIYDAALFVQAGAIDDSAGTSVISATMIESALEGGSVTVIVTASSLTLDESLTYNSSNALSLVSSYSLDFTSISLLNENAVGGDLILVAGYDSDQTAWVIKSDDSTTWVVDTEAFDDATLSSTTGPFGQSSGSVIIGDGSQTSGVAVGSRSGTTSVYAAGLTLMGGGTSGAYAQLGYQVSNAGDTYEVSGDIVVRLTGDLSLTGGSADYTYAQVGHLGADQTSDNTYEATVSDANITVDALGAVSVIGRSGDYAYAQIGHGGDTAYGDMSGTITVTSGGDLTVSGSTGFYAYAMLGHGGYEASSTNGISGAIIVTVGGNLTISGGAAEGASAQLGHGGGSARGIFSGDITITDAQNITVSAGAGFQAYAQLGHGGGGLIGETSGTITITSAQDITVTGGAGYAAYAQLGHGGSSAMGIFSGDITITDAQNITITGGSRDYTYAQLGHGGYYSSGDMDGDITIASAATLTILGGSGGSTYAQLGHGSANFGETLLGSTAESLGTRQGDILISLTGELSLEDGTDPATTYAYAWLGHASADSDAISDADLTVTAASIDADASGTVASGLDSTLTLSADILTAALANGDVWIEVTNTGLSLSDAIVITSDNDLTLVAANDITLTAGASISSTGAGNVVLAAGEDFHNDSDSTEPITVGTGRWLIYSTRPDDNSNDIEITNWNFLRYGLTFDADDPAPTTLQSRNGLIYSVTPILAFVAEDQTLEEGDVIESSSVSVSLVLNGAAIDAEAFGIDLDTSSVRVVLASSVTRAADGTATAGTWSDGLELDMTSYSTHSGVSVVSLAGDLTVTAQSSGGGGSGTEDSGDDETGGETGGETGDDETGDDETGGDETGSDDTGDNTGGDTAGNEAGDDTTGDDTTGDDTTGDETSGDDEAGTDETGGQDSVKDETVTAETEDTQLKYQEKSAWDVFRIPRQALCQMAGGGASCFDTSGFKP